MAQRNLKVIFFGTADFAVPCLEAVIEAGHSVTAVVTQPDKPQGRGQRLASSPVKVAALRLGLPVLQPKRVRSELFINRIREIAPDVLALAAFGQIVPQGLLDLPPLGPINVHGSLLPKYRGAAPIQRAVMAGETVTGITTMWMDATLDTGDILLQEAMAIEPEETAGSLFPKLAQLGAKLLVETLERAAAGTLVRLPQNNAMASQAPALKPEDGYLDWTEPAARIDCRIRGVTPKPGAFTAMQGQRLKVWAVRPEESSSSDTGPGAIIGYSKAPAGVRVAAGGGSALILTQVQPESGKRMAADSWARGKRLAPGDRFESVADR